MSTEIYTDPARVPIGLDARQRWLFLRFTSVENPHILIVGGSQTGKTTLQILIAAMAAARGNIVIILDPKLRFSRPFRHPVTREPLPNVLVYRSPDAMRAAMEWHGVTGLLVAEMQRRYQADEAANQSVLTDQKRFPTVLLIADELGTLNDFADADWQRRKPEGFKGKTPTREYLQIIHRMGAEARIICCSANQTAKEDELPAGTRTRILCGQRVFLGRISEGRQWMMLAGDGVERPEIPDGQKGAGAALFGNGTPVRFQVAFLDWVKHPEQVYELAAQGLPILRENGHIDASGRLLLGGVPLPRPGEMWSQVAAQDDAAQIISLPGDPTPAAAEALAELEPEPALIVGNAAAAQFCRMSLPNFRKHRAQYPIPGEIAKHKGNQPAWPETELEKWSAERAETRRTLNERSA
ncbi:MAG: type IV secretory system conjugative DNA transfer family protein [Thermoanaerobaculia bacterium]